MENGEQSPTVLRHHVNLSHKHVARHHTLPLTCKTHRLFLAAVQPTWRMKPRFCLLCFDVVGTFRPTTPLTPLCAPLVSSDRVHRARLREEDSEDEDDENDGESDFTAVSSSEESSDDDSDESEEESDEDSDEEV